VKDQQTVHQGISALHIRPATLADAETIAAFHALSWRNTYNGILSDRYLNEELDEDRLCDWRQRLQSPVSSQHVVVAQRSADDAEVIGFACAYGAFDKDAGTLLENLHAHPKHKQQGTGKLLLQHIARWSVAHYPDDALHLWVVEPNLAAIGFYRHMGAVEDAQALWDAPDGSSIPEIRYTWPDPTRLYI
jgi:GNAT superfamily N-acetyltransferase